MSRLRSGWIGFMAGMMVLLASSPLSAAVVTILSPYEQPHGPVLKGIEELERVLTQQGWTVQRAFGNNRSARLAEEFQIVVVPFAAFREEDPEVQKFKELIPAQPESLAVFKTVRGNVVRAYALGSDPIGAMYATYELAEQIERTVNISMVQRIVETKASPSIPNRGIQLALHKQALDDPYSWFHSEAFWKGLLHTLSISRFNFLELQGVYDLVDTTFSNMMPYFIAEQSSLAPEAVQKNLQSLQNIVDWAHEYGLTVALINSGDSWDSQTPTTLNYATFQPRMSQALSLLLKHCPSLDALGFQVSEAALPAGYYVETYERAISESVSKPALMLHTWAADAQQIARLVDPFPGKSVLELKFNGDHLALPYPVTGGRMLDWPTYSYEGYFQQPRKYGLLFEFPFNGTHRIFPFGDANFIRRTLASATYAGANGFVLQTYSTFLPHADAYTNPIRSDLRYFDWTYQRDWYWYLLWGRLAFDTQLSEVIFERKFQEHFGPEAGTLLYRAIQNASQVIPAIAATCFRGPGLRDFSPELEPPVSLEEIKNLRSLDSFTIRSVSDEIRSRVTGQRDGRYAPQDLLSDAVESGSKAVDLVDQAEKPLTSWVGNLASTPEKMNVLKEWKSWQLDFKAMAALGRYWLDQVNAAVHLGIYQQSGDIPSLIITSESLKNAEHAWKQVQEETSLHFRPLLDSLRNKTSQFHWKLLPSPIADDRLYITKLYNAWMDETQWPSTPGHIPTPRIPLNFPLLLSLSIPPKIEMESLVVQFQNQRGSTGRFSLRASDVKGVYYADIDPSSFQEGGFQYFFLGVTKGAAESKVVPESGLPYSTIITDDADSPVCTHLEHVVSPSRNQVFVTARFSDASGIDTAAVWWKPLPSNVAWKRTQMEGIGDLHQGVFPLTEAGAQYAIEAVDGFGNILRYPDEKKETPYVTIPPFEK